VIPKANNVPSDSRAVLALSIVSAIAWLTPVHLPFLVGEYVEYYGKSDSVAGWLASAEIGSLALAAAVTAVLLGRISPKQPLRIGLVLSALGAAATVLSSSFLVLVLSRLVLGIGLGLIAAASNAIPAGKENSTRIYAVMIVAMGVMGAVLLVLTPIALRAFGRSGAFLCELLLIVVALPFARWLPEGPVRIAPKSPGMKAHGVRISSICGIAALFLVYVGRGAVWSHAERVGVLLHLSDRSLGIFFGVSALSGLAGAVIALLVGLRAGQIVPLVIGTILQMLAAIFIYVIVGKNFLVGSLQIFNFAGLFLTPYVMGLLAELDSTGRVAGFGGSAINFGLAIGPGLASVFLVRFGYQMVGYSASAEFLVAVILLLPVVFSQLPRQEDARHQTASGPSS